jgi:hypothetical protein
MKKKLMVIGLFFAIAGSGCSTLVNESHLPINLSFSDNSAGECSLRNKRESYKVQIPSSALVRRSDDPLVYECTTEDGREAYGSILSDIGQTMAGNIILGGGIGAIIDANNDMHREYPGSFVIPVVKQ